MSLARYELARSAAGAGMAHYRLYFLNSLGRIVRPETVEAGTDDDAIVAARAFDHACGIEIWDGARQVATVRPDPTKAV